MVQRFSLLALLGLGVLSGCGVEPTKEVPAEYKAGQANFHKVCANCHGADAMGGDTKGPRLIDAEFIPPDFTDDDIRDTVVNGSSSGKMSSQKSKFSDAEITEIIKYLRHSQKAAGIEAEEEPEEEEEE